MRGKKGIRIHALDFFILKKGDPHSYPHTLLLRLCFFLICVVMMMMPLFALAETKNVCTQAGREFSGTSR
jgi:hypothetical protein